MMGFRFVIQQKAKHSWHNKGKVIFFIFFILICVSTIWASSFWTCWRRGYANIFVSKELYKYDTNEYLYRNIFEYPNIRHTLVSANFPPNLCFTCWQRTLPRALLKSTSSVASTLTPISSTIMVEHWKYTISKTYKVTFRLTWNRTIFWPLWYFLVPDREPLFGPFGTLWYLLVQCQGPDGEPFVGPRRRWSSAIGKLLLSPRLLLPLLLPEELVKTIQPGPGDALVRNSDFSPNFGSVAWEQIFGLATNKQIQLSFEPWLQWREDRHVVWQRRQV